jgi:hypothetical protein
VGAERCFIIDGYKFDKKESGVKIKFFEKLVFSDWVLGMILMQRFSLAPPQG